MRVFPEYFDQTQFQLASVEQAHTIKRPYINFHNTVNFSFQEYHSNLRLQCVHWNRLVNACINTFGYFDFLKHIRCLESTEYFRQCLSLNAYFAYHKKYYSNEYFYDEYYKASPHYNDVLIKTE